MFELIWGILNGLLLIYFIIICFKSVNIIKEKIGILASLVFVIGLLSFISKPNENKIADKNIEILNQTNPKKAFNGNTYLRFVTLEDNLTSKIELTILCGEKESDNELIILNADCNRTGFISGTNWNDKNIDWWYRQNMFIVKKRVSSEEEIPANQSNLYVHPELFYRRLQIVTQKYERLLSGKAGLRTYINLLIKSLKNKILS